MIRFFANKRQEHIDLPNPDWVRDYMQPENIKVRRAMSGKLRVFKVDTLDRSSCNLAFDHLHRDKTQELLMFLTGNEGDYYWYYGPTGTVAGMIVAYDGVSLEITKESLPIAVGDFCCIDGLYYRIIDKAAGFLQLDQPVSGGIANSPITIIKPQLILITNSDVKLVTAETANLDDEGYQVQLGIKILWRAQ